MTKRRITIDCPVLKIVGDGGISSPDIGEGRFIPALIIDVGDNIEIEELIKLHLNSLPGDTELQWSHPDTFFRAKEIFLILSFIRPMKMQFAIEFSLDKQYSLIDGIINSRAVHLQTGKLGDKISEFKSDSIMIEVPNMNYDSKWNELLVDTLTRKYNKLGVPKRERKNIIKEHIIQMREVWNLRRDNLDSDDSN